MNVLFIDSVHPVLWERLNSRGVKCVDATSWEHSKVMEQIAVYQGIVIRSKFPVNKAFFEKAMQLKFVARSGAGLENIDLHAADVHGVKIFNSPEGNRNAVAEHALGMLLSLFNKLNQGHQQVTNRVWDREGNRGVELDGLTVGLIGFGNTGQRLARKLQGFDVNVVAYDKYHPSEGQYGVSAVSLNELQKQADVVSFHVPQTPETTYMLNADFIEQTSKPFYLLNTSRGKVVDTASLVAGLKTGKVRGACLDVLEYESSAFTNFSDKNMPEPFTYLARANNVLLSPHVAGWTVESYYKLSSVLFDKIAAEFDL